MNRKAVLVGVLVLMLSLGFVTIISAQSDTDFRAWLARLNGSRWFEVEDGESKVYMELQGNILTRWYSDKRTGGKVKHWSVKIEKPGFVVKTDTYAAIYEISKDGYFITQEITWDKYTPENVGVVKKLIKEN